MSHTLKTMSQTFQNDENGNKQPRLPGSVVPKINYELDTESKILVQTEVILEEMKKQSKNSFWKNLLITILGGAIGCIIATYAIPIITLIFNLLIEIL